MTNMRELARTQDKYYELSQMDRFLQKANLVALAGEQAAFLLAPAVLGTPDVGIGERIVMGAVHAVCFLIARAKEKYNETQFNEMGQEYGRLTDEAQAQHRVHS